MMFCTKCGKKIYEDDRFCASCGAEVRRESQASKMPSYDDVVFNPPFKVAAQKRTEEIIGFKKEEKKEEPSKKEEKPRERERIAFDWNLDGYPSSSPRKTEEVNFDWNSVIEKRQTQSGFGIILEESKKENKKETKPLEEKIEPVVVEKIIPSSILSDFQEDMTVSTKIYNFEKELEELERALKRPKNIPAEEVLAEGKTVEEFHAEEFHTEEFPAEEIQIEDAIDISADFLMEDSAKEEDTLTLEDLEKELFGSRGDTTEYTPLTSDEIALSKAANSVNKDKFYTYNQKAMAFEALVEKEKARLDSLGISLNNEDDSDIEEIYDLEKEEIYDLEKEENFDIDKKEESDVVCVVQPFTPQTITVDEELVDVKEEKPENKEEKLEEEKLEEKEGSAIDEGDGTEKNPDLDSIFGQFDEDEEPKKKRVFVKLIIALLVIMIAIEGFIIGVKLIAPDSKLAESTDQIIANIIDKLMGIERIEEIQGDEIPNYDISDYMSGVVDNVVGTLKNSSKLSTIGKIEYDKSLVYDKNQTYVFDEIPRTSEFVDTDWLLGENGEDTTYGTEIIAAVIDYYEGWRDTNTDDELVGINELSIGEIRTGEKGFYILCNLIYAGTEGDEIESNQSVYAIVSGEKIVVDTIKEETL